MPGPLTTCWNEKGLFRYMRNAPWSEMVNGRVVLTCWNNPQDQDDSELKFIGGEDILHVDYDGTWEAKPKGRKFMKHCKDLLTSGVMAEVIMIKGRRFPVPSKVHNAYIDPYHYYVRIVEADPKTGRIRGKFFPKEKA